MATHNINISPSPAGYWRGCRCEECKEAIRARDKARYAINPTPKLLSSKRYKDSNREHHNQVNARWYANNKARVIQNVRRWQAAHPERVKTYQKATKQNGLDKKWRKENPDKVRAWNRRRKAIKRGADGSHTLTEWLEILERFNRRCAHCGSPENITQDHVIPISKGGTDYASNLQPLCGSCNSRKHDKLPTANSGQSPDAPTEQKDEQGNHSVAPPAIPRAGSKTGTRPIPQKPQKQPDRE